MADTEKSPPVDLPEWLSEKRVLVVWIVSFGILILLSFFIFVPIAMTISDADGSCFLYAHHYGFGDSSVCAYCVAIAVIFLCICIPRLLLLIMKITNFSTKITDGVSSWFSIWGVHIIILVLDMLLWLLLLVTACLLSVGLTMMCEDLFGDRDLCSSDKGVYLPNGEVNTSFYSSLAYAEGSAWFTVCYWLLVVILETFLLWKSGTIGEMVSAVTSKFQKDTPPPNSSTKRVEKY